MPGRSLAGISGDPAPGPISVIRPPAFCGYTVRPVFLDERGIDRIDWCIGAMERSIQPVKLVTQVVLVVGFGALLAMMALAGIDSISVLVQIHARNLEIRRNYLIRNRSLEQIRAGLYVSGTSAQDYLLEHDALAAENYRATLQTARKDVAK